MNLVHYLQSIDFVTRTGTFLYRTEKDTSWVQVDVSISPLLCWRILNKSSNKHELLPINVPYKGQVFTTDINSFKYEDSPFNLVIWKPKSGEGAVNCVLECVDEKSIPIKDVFTDKIIGYEKGARKAIYKSRYEVREYVNATERNIVSPNYQSIPVG